VTAIILPGSNIVISAIKFALSLWSALKSIYDAVAAILYWGNEYLSTDFIKTNAYKTMRNSVFLTTRNDKIAKSESYSDAGIYADWDKIMTEIK